MKSAMLVLAALFAIGQAAINDGNCGLRPLYNPNEVIADPMGRVVGGNATTRGDHRWQIALLRNGNFICGGSLLDEHTVLCAAHCTSTIVNPSWYKVVRTWDRSPFDSWAQTRDVTKLVNHPSYSSSTYSNDISLLFVSEPFDFSRDEVGHICIAKDDPAEKERAIASGWGSTYSGGSVVTQLREAYMPITDIDAIRAQYGNSYNPITMIGAAYPGDGLDTCQGDSGGPLSVQHKGSRLPRLEQVGIVSWGYGCGDIGIYTRVSTYYQWIQDQNKEFLSSIGK